MTFTDSDIQAIRTLCEERVKKGGPDECWRWLMSLTNYGYGQFFYRRVGLAAHRIMYEAEHGTIPKGLQIDHLCRNRWCCNPAHMEAVTSRENTLRGMGPSALNARKTHCVHGHPLSGENLRREGRKRRCKECGRARCRQHYHRKAREEAANG